VAPQSAIGNIADAGALRPWRNYTPYLVGIVVIVKPRKLLA
jgi:hypothetical protein